MNEIIHEIEGKYGSLLIRDGSKFLLGLQSFAELYRQQTRCIYLPGRSSFINIRRETVCGNLKGGKR